MAFKIKDSLRVGTVDIVDQNGNLLVTASKATNVAGGAAGQVNYQSAANTTAFVANGTAGQFLKSNGSSAPTWADIPSSVTIADDNSTASDLYLALVSSTTGNLTQIKVDGTTTPLKYVPSTGTLSAAVFSGSGASLTSIPNAALVNSSITINGSAIALGGSVAGLALTASTLAQFAATTSAQLAGVISDETGSGKLTFATSPTFTTSVLTDSASLAVFNTTATTVNAFGAATTLTLGASTGTTTISNNLTIAGNLTINGTTTTVNSTTVTIDDPIFTLGGDTAPASDDAKDRGIEFRWHNGTAAKVGFFGFDRSTGKMTFIPDATSTSEVFSGSVGEIDATIAWSNVTGDTTVGSNLVTLTNPSAISFLRINADNTVSTLDAATFRTAIGAQASGSYLTAEADTLAAVTGRGATTATAIALTNTTDSTSSTTGALIIDGGVSIKKNLTVVGNIAETTAAGTKIADSNAVQATVATVTATSVDSWAVATYRSCKYVVQITQGTNYQVSEILVIHNGTTTTMTEFAVLETNGALAAFTSDVNAGNARLLVTMSAATSATVNITKTMMVI